MTRDNDNSQQLPSGRIVHGVVPGSYGAQVQLACKEAEQIEVLAHKEANPGLFQLYAYAVSAVDNAVTIVKYSRLTTIPPVGEFVGQQTRLSVFLKRIEGIPDLSSVVAIWPRAPGQTLSWLAGSSALDVAIKFAKMIHAATVVSSGKIRLDGSLGYGQLPVLPEAHACFVKWRDKTVEEILTRQVPKPDLWPAMADIHREYNSLKYKMRAEYEAAMKTRTRRTAVPKRIEKILFQESVSRCCKCNEGDIHKLTIHHIIPWADNPTHDVRHMIVLCANCHASATAGTISREELYAAKEGCGRIIPLRTASTEEQPFSVSGNGNVVAGRDLNYTIRVSHKGRGAKPIQVPVSGTVSEDPLMRGYLKYLFDRYLAFKKWECDKKGVKLTGAPIYLGYKRDMKFDWKLTPMSHFDKGADYLKQRIDKTTIGRMKRAQGNRLYRSFEEFQTLGPD